MPKMDRADRAQELADELERKAFARQWWAKDDYVYVFESYGADEETARSAYEDSLFRACSEVAFASASALPDDDEEEFDEEFVDELFGEVLSRADALTKEALKS